jgi:predicted  nucleic acid-binding Zn-ribbon protein
METLVERAERLGVATATVSEMLDEIERARAQVDVANAAMQAAVSKAQWQARTNHEMNQLCAENERLRDAIRQTLEENGHLADGENCTLIVLKRALMTPNSRTQATAAAPEQHDRT